MPVKDPILCVIPDDQSRLENARESFSTGCQFSIKKLYLSNKYHWRVFESSFVYIERAKKWKFYLEIFSLIFYLLNFVFFLVYFVLVSFRAK